VAQRDQTVMAHKGEMQEAAVVVREVRALTAVPLGPPKAVLPGVWAATAEVEQVAALLEQTAPPERVVAEVEVLLSVQAVEMALKILFGPRLLTVRPRDLRQEEAAAADLREMAERVPAGMVEAGAEEASEAVQEAPAAKE